MVLHVKEEHVEKIFQLISTGEAATKIALMETLQSMAKVSLVYLYFCLSRSVRLSAHLSMYTTDCCGAVLPIQYSMWYCAL